MKPINLPNFDAIQATHEANRTATLANEKEFVGGSFVGMSTFSTMGSNTAHPIFPILNDCTGGRLGEDPRSLLFLYRSLQKVIPIYDQAIQWSAFALGNLCLESKDRGLQTLLEEFEKDFQIKYSHNQEFSIEKGLSNYIKKILTEAQGTDGMAFGELYRNNRREPITGVVAKDAALFEYMTIDSIEWNLYMHTLGGPERLKPSSMFVAYSAEHPARYGQYWGRSNMWGTEKAAQDFLMFMAGRKGVHERLGSLLTHHMFSADVDSSMQLGPKDMAAIQNTKNDFVKDWESVRAYQARTGRGADISSVWPNKMHVDRWVHGQGVAVPNDFPEEFNILMKEIARGGRTPIMFLDLSSESSGFGDGKFTLGADQLMAIAKSDQDRLRPVIEQIVKAFLISAGASERQLNNWEPVWETPNLEDMKAKWEAEKLKAETQGVQLVNWQTMRMELSKEAQNYAEEIGRPDLGKMDSDIPPPAPEGM